MKLEFGSMLSRWLWNGIRLLPIEQVILTNLVDALPEHLRLVLLEQINACNLVQREVDGRELNFYRKIAGKVTRDGIPPLPIPQGEVPLLSIVFKLVDHGASQQKAAQVNITATMFAIDQQFFCISLSQDMRQFPTITELAIQQIKPFNNSDPLIGGTC